MSVNSQKTVTMIGRVAEKGFDDFCAIADQFRLEKDFKFIWFGEVAQNISIIQGCWQRKIIHLSWFC